MGVYCLQEGEEVGPVLRVLLKVLVDHVQGALKHGVKDLGDLDGDVGLQLIHHCCHHRQHLRFPSTEE